MQINYYISYLSSINNGLLRYILNGVYLVRSMSIFHGVPQDQQCGHCQAIEQPHCEAKKVYQAAYITWDYHDKGYDTLKENGGIHKKCGFCHTNLRLEIVLVLTVKTREGKGVERLM